MQACNDFLRLGPGRTFSRLLSQYSQPTKTDRNLPVERVAAPPTLSLATLKDWSDKYSWSERAKEYDKAIEDEKNERRRQVMEEGLALDFERVASLKKLAAFLEGEIYEQAKPKPVSAKLKMELDPEYLPESGVLNEETIPGVIDGLIHDAEQAEAGAQFASLMERTQPDVQEHTKVKLQLSDKARRLRMQAAYLTDQLEGGGAPSMTSEEFYHKVWLPDVKQIGGGEHAERVDIVRFNAALIEQYRGTLDDIAKEKGERKQKMEVTGKDGGAITHKITTIEVVRPPGAGIATGDASTVDAGNSSNN